MAHDEGSEVRDDLWVMTLSEDHAYYWNRLERTSHWEMPPGRRPCWVRSLDDLFVLVESQDVAVDLNVGRARCGPRTSWRASFSLMVDVVLPVIMQRQVLAVLYRLTVEVPQIQFIVRCKQRKVPTSKPVLGQVCWRRPWKNPTYLQLETGLWTIFRRAPSIWQSLAQVVIRQSAVAYGRVSQFLRGGGWCPSRSHMEIWAVFHGHFVFSALFRTQLGR